MRYDVRHRGTDGTERSKTFRTRHDADRFAATVETDKLRGTWVDPQGARITLDSTARWYDDTAVAAPQATLGTYGQLASICSLAQTRG